MRSCIVLELVHNVALALFELVVVVDIETVFLSHFFQTAVEVEPFESIHVIGLPGPDPEHVGDDGVSKSHRAAKGLQNIPRESNIRAVLRDSVLHAERKQESICSSVRSHVCRFF